MFDPVQLRQLETELERVIDKLQHDDTVTRSEILELLSTCQEIVRKILRMYEWKQ